ncbi:MAG: hypothetical protein K2Q18_17100 [Bdellovibrionales bacterium]|nr:hypothetical protein [Bdellovibrionales bacterium]
MTLFRYQRLLQVQIRRLQKYTNRKWYLPLVSLLSLLDNFLIVIPNDGILISSSMISPKKWHKFAVAIAIGSSIGAIILAYFVEIHGLPFILDLYPGIEGGQIWKWTEKFLEHYGLLFVLIVGLTPVMQQPVVILASLANIPLLDLGLAVFISRLIKFLVMAYIASFAPGYLRHFWGARKELEMVGEIDKGNSDLKK